ncbi:Flp pilus assembly protein CpaB [Actinomyces bovis]|uniref:Flp pilus assembly protein CpaB n=1 Tax=Actinomyces bovis TaxID=1658 RepID=A0ABY1VQ28_9ACTO|nr:SAF domain-containing protein [Actinomyces bovis]SPT54228.1 Flp pilus assembly protein CpaB [Actinomyces bovis]VEG56498.1 Flp pilus assembly protein CpaB [Actinomyces israelii]
MAPKSSDTRSRHRQAPERHSTERTRGGLRRRLFWGRHRHLILAACLATAVILLVPRFTAANSGGSSVLVVAHRLEAGQSIDSSALKRSNIPESALPAAGLADEAVIGQRAAISLEEGTVLTTSMTSGSAATDLSEDERLIEVPVAIGAELATPGARVDVVAPCRNGQMGEVTPKVVGHDLRVVSTRRKTEEGIWKEGTSITLISLAVPKQDASLVVGAASDKALSIMLSH